MTLLVQRFRSGSQSSDSSEGAASPLEFVPVLLTSSPSKSTTYKVGEAQRIVKAHRQAMLELESELRSACMTQEKLKRIGRSCYIIEFNKDIREEIDFSKTVIDPSTSIPSAENIDSEFEEFSFRLCINEAAARAQGIEDGMNKYEAALKSLDSRSEEELMSTLETDRDPIEELLKTPERVQAMIAQAKRLKELLDAGQLFITQKNAYPEPGCSCIVQ